MRPWIPSIVVAVSGVLVSHASAQQFPPSDAVDWGRKSLESSSRLPWYDTEKDQLRQIEVEPCADDTNRHSSWAASDRPPQAGGRQVWNLPSTILQTVAWIALVSFLVFLIWVLVWAASRADFSGTHSGDTIQTVSAGQSRIEDLPIPVSNPYQDLFSAARAYFDAGDYGKAIVYAFAHQLVELDKHHLIQLSKGKTNRQYLQELQQHPHFMALVRPTMLAFEDVFFGHHQLSQQRFQTCWEDLNQFHQQLEQVAP